MKKASFGMVDKMWRLMKVIYFIITVPVVIITFWFIFSTTLIYQSFGDVNDKYLGFFYGILVILGYIIFSDLLRRVISYIKNGIWIGVIPYKDLFTIYRIRTIKYIIIIFICFGMLFIGSYSLRNFCTGKNESPISQSSCGCVSGYIREGSTCQPNLGTVVKSKLPENIFLREIWKVPGKENAYIGIYITDYTIADEKGYENNGVPYGYYCPYLQQGRWIEGKYHIFTFVNSEVTSDLEIPLEFSDKFKPKGNKIKISYINTKANNKVYYNGLGSEDDKYGLEISRLINFADYDGDGIENEFSLFYFSDDKQSLCSSSYYLYAGYDDKTSKAVIYSVKGIDGVHAYWTKDANIKKKGGLLVDETNCEWVYQGDSLGEIKTDYYFFDRQAQTFVFEKSETKSCVPE